MEAKKVLAMKQLMQSIEHKVHELTREIYSFKKIFKEVISFGLSGLWDGVRDLYPEKNYKKRLDNKRNDDSRFTKMEGTLKGYDVMDMIARDFVLLCTLRFIFKKIHPSSYERFTDLDEMRRNLKPLEYPMGNVWKNMCRYLKVQIP